MFLTDEDYKSVCDDFELEQLQAHTDIRNQAEKAAIEKISSYTRDRYDMKKAFAQKGEGRNAMLVDCAVNIALYILVHRLPGDMGSERRDQLYEDSIQWLKDVQASKATPDLPRYISDDGDDTDSHNPVRFGSGLDKVGSCTW